jgi:hypothetical protein
MLPTESVVFQHRRKLRKIVKFQTKYLGLKGSSGQIGMNRSVSDMPRKELVGASPEITNLAIILSVALRRVPECIF